GLGYKRVAVVEDFYDIIYGVHVADQGGSRSGFHAGQKKTYRAVTERYAFLPREAVTRFLLGCAECQKRVDFGEITGSASSTPLTSKRTHDAADSMSSPPEYLPINLTTKNCIIRLSVPNFNKKNWMTATSRSSTLTSSTPTKRPRMSSSSEETSEISPISTDESSGLCLVVPDLNKIKQAGNGETLSKSVKKPQYLGIQIPENPKPTHQNVVLPENVNMGRRRSRGIMAVRSGSHNHHSTDDTEPPYQHWNMVDRSDDRLGPQLPPSRPWSRPVARRSAGRRTGRAALSPPGMPVVRYSAIRRCTAHRRLKLAQLENGSIVESFRPAVTSTLGRLWVFIFN
ncbi:unnamed protein product, partial [Nesidiocoris tenuis]